MTHYCKECNRPCLCDVCRAGGTDGFLKELLNAKSITQLEQELQDAIFELKGENQNEKGTN